MIGASSRPITLSLSRATKALADKVEVARKREEAAKAKAKAAAAGGGGGEGGAGGAYAESNGLFAAYFTEGVSFSLPPASAGPSVQQVTPTKRERDVVHRAQSSLARFHDA
jgi:hypothetical protein